MEAFSILISTILLRPYVFALLGFYLIAGCLQLGLKRIAAFTILAYFIAFISEYTSTRIWYTLWPLSLYGWNPWERVVYFQCSFYGLAFVLLPGVLQLFSCSADSFAGNKERVEIWTVASSLVCKKSTLSIGNFVCAPGRVNRPCVSQGFQMVPWADILLPCKRYVLWGDFI